MHDAFTIEALKAHIFDPEYTKLITKARLRNCAMLQIVDLMSISRPRNSKREKEEFLILRLELTRWVQYMRHFLVTEDLLQRKICMK